MVQLTKQDEQTLIKEIMIYKRPLEVGNYTMKEILSVVASDASHYFCVAQSFNDTKYILEYDKKNDFKLSRVNDLKLDELHELLAVVKSNQLTHDIKLIDLVDEADVKSQYSVWKNNCILCVNRIIKFLNSKMKPNYQKIQLACLNQLRFAFNFLKKQISNILHLLKKQDKINLNSAKNFFKEFKSHPFFKKTFIINFGIQLVSDFLKRQNYSIKDLFFTLVISILLILLTVLIQNGYVFITTQIISFFGELMVISFNQNLNAFQKITKISVNLIQVCEGFIPIPINIFAEAFPFCYQFLTTIIHQWIEGEMELSVEKKIFLGLATIGGATLNACCQLVPITVSCASLSIALTTVVGGIMCAGICFAGIKLCEKAFRKK